MNKSHWFVSINFEYVSESKFKVHPVSAFELLYLPSLQSSGLVLSISLDLRLFYEGGLPIPEFRGRGYNVHVNTVHDLSIVGMKSSLTAKQFLTASCYKRQGQKRRKTGCMYWKQLSINCKL